MDYFKLLPSNIHEDVMNRFNLFNNFYDVELKDEYDNDNGHICFIKKYNKNELDCNVLYEREETLVSKFYQNIKKLIKFEDNTFIFEIESGTLYFKGNQKIYFTNENKYDDNNDNNSLTVLNLTREANQKLFDKLCQKFYCHYCYNKIHFNIVNNKIIINDSSEYCDKNCNFTTSIVYNRCYNNINFIHTSCKIACNKCNSVICNLHNETSYCFLCKTYNCGSKECQCKHLCESCKKSVCKTITKTYTTEIKLPYYYGSSTVYTCEKCMKQCPGCKKYGPSTLKLEKCSKCSKQICNRDNCLIHYFGKGELKNGRCKDCLNEFCEICGSEYNLIELESYSLSLPIKCSGCQKKNICKNCWVKCQTKIYDETKYDYGYACKLCVQPVLVEIPRLKSLVKE